VTPSDREIELWYEQQGSGSPIILLHAFAVSGEIWYPQSTALVASGYRAISVDLRGHGHSPAPKDPYTIRQMADDVRCLIDHLQLDSVYLVGLSMGGRIALQIAIDHPSVVTALLLVSTKTDPIQIAREELQRLLHRAEQDGAAEAVKEWYARISYRRLTEIEPDFMERMLAVWQDKAKEGFTGAAHALLNMETLTPHLAEIRIPTLAIAGELDEACHPYIDLYHRSMPRCYTSIIPRAGHFVNLEQIEAFNQRMLEFLEDCEFTAGY
jgi:pimeloyl-ACP methyl ester carboxylesterase